MLTRGINAQGAWVLTQGESGCILIIKKADTDLEALRQSHLFIDRSAQWVIRRLLSAELGMYPGTLPPVLTLEATLESPMACSVHGVHGDPTCIPGPVARPGASVL